MAVFVPFFLHFCFKVNVYKRAFPKMVLNVYVTDKMSVFCSALSVDWYIMKTLIQTCGNGIVPFYIVLRLFSIKYRVKTC